MNLKEEIKNCYSVTDFCKLLNLSQGGGGFIKAKKIIQDNNLDISHFDKGYLKRQKNPKIEKTCPVCDKKFETVTWSNKKEKTTCSKSCANSYFRSGINNPNWKDDSYRTTCFFYHKKECLICGEEKIVEVHHIDENHMNNKPENLVPLCPTHHQYWHSRYKEEIEDKIYKYIKEFKNMTTTTQYQQQQQINRTD
jgi:hypothetical protein